MNAPLSLHKLLPELDHSHLDWLEEEAIFILRETVAAFMGGLRSSTRRVRLP